MAWDGRAVTPEEQIHILDGILSNYRDKGIDVAYQNKIVCPHTLIMTQNGLEAEKFADLLNLPEEMLEVPVIVESHFFEENGQTREYVLDGHHRAAIAVKRGRKRIDAYVITSPSGGAFTSGYVKAAEFYDNRRIRDLQEARPAGEPGGQTF